jgi:WD40 repeat protein
VHHIRVSPANDQIIVTTAQDVRRVNLSVVPKWSNENSSVDLVEVAGDGSTFVTSTFNRAWMYHASGALFWEQIVPGGNALALAYSRDGSTIVLGRDDNTVRVLDRNGTLLWTGKAGGWVTSVAVSDDGSLIAAGSMDRNLYVYDRAGNLLGTYYANAPIKSRSVGVSGDGSLIAAADMTAVYGFSRQQFEPPVVVVTTLPVTPVVTTSATPSPPPTATATVPVTTLPTTPRADLPLFVPLLAAAILAAYRRTRFS